MQPPTPQLEGRVVVVTGGARGMGRAFVRGALAAGARAVATDRSWAGVDDFRAELASNERALVLDMDVTSDAQVDEVFDQTIAKFGTTDVLINNAALLNMFLFPPTGRLTTLETTPEDWRKALEVNVIGPLRVSRRFAPPMIEKRRGSIINIVSSGILNFSRGGGYHALRPESLEMPYMACKAALANMSFYMGAELRAHNVAVNTIIPGHTRGSWFDDTVRSRIAVGMHPGRRPVRPEHMVPLALFLASQDASGVTGTMFDVMEWNAEHGFGDYNTWFERSLPEDLERAFAAAETAAR